MPFYKLYAFLFSLKLATCGCDSDNQENGFTEAQNKYALKKIGKMPSSIDESSGLAKASQENFYWTHNDSGGTPELFLINEKGNIFDTLLVKNSKNIDWEDLAKDNEGNIYVGDFGNNAQNRKDLTIYKLKDGKTEKINFHYADQAYFPARERVFDCEAFFWYGGKLYLFSKDWTSKHQTLLYSLPDKPGNYALLPEQNIYLKGLITSADISPSGKEFALLSYGKIYIFEVYAGKIDFSKPKYCIKIGRSQMEAIAYVNDTDLIMTNEQGKIYRVNRKK